MRKIFWDIGGLLFIWIVLIIILLPIFNPGIPYGTDVYVHLFNAWYVGDHFIKFHEIPSWCPYWFSGFPMLSTYPPLTTLAFVPLYIWTGDIFTCYKIFTLIVFLLLSMSMYIIVRRQYNILAGVIGSLIFSLAPYILSVYFEAGSLSRIFSLIFLPPFFYLSINLIEKTYDSQNITNRPIILHIIFLSVITTFFILAHVQIAAFSIITFYIYYFFYLLLTKKFYIKGFLAVTGSILLGISLSAWWLVPVFFDQLVDVTPNIEATFVRRSVPLLSIISRPFFDKIQYGPYVGFSILIASFINVIINKRPRDTALFIGGLFGIFYALGEYNPFLSFINFPKLIPPHKALYISIFIFSYLSSSLFVINILNQNDYVIKRLLKIGVPVLMLIIICSDIVFSNGFSLRYPIHPLIKNVSYSSDVVVTISEDLKTMENNGRLFINYNFFPSVMISFFPIIEGKKLQASGNIIGNSNQIPYLGSMDEILFRKMDPSYIIKKFSQYAVRYLLLSKRMINPQWKDALKNDGFELFKTYDQKNNQILLYYKSSSPSYVQIMDRNVLAIGKYVTNVSVLFPWVVEGNSSYIEDYDKKYLSLFDEIILYGFAYRDKEKAENIISDFVKNGGTVIIDMSGVKGEWWEQDISFFNISTVPFDFLGKVTITKNEDTSILSGVDLAFSSFESPRSFKTVGGEPIYRGDSWRSIGYLNLDNNYLDITLKEEHYSILGIKNIIGGKIYFVGLNLFYHTFLVEDKNTFRLLGNLLEIGKPKTKIGLSNLTIFNEEWGDEMVKFSYETKHETPALISISYSPHWKTTIDGKEVKVYNHENLILLFLPKGTHDVKIIYGQTNIQIVSYIISISTFVFLVLIYIRG
jgi:uncharacterized membrane protein